MAATGVGQRSSRPPGKRGTAKVASRSKRAISPAWLPPPVGRNRGKGDAKAGIAAGAVEAGADPPHERQPARCHRKRAAPSVIDGDVGQLREHLPPASGRHGVRRRTIGGDPGECGHNKGRSGNRQRRRCRGSGRQCVSPSGSGDGDEIMIGITRASAWKIPAPILWNGSRSSGAIIRARTISFARMMLMAGQPPSGGRAEAAKPISTMA